MIVPAIRVKPAFGMVEAHTITLFTSAVNVFENDIACCVFNRLDETIQPKANTE